MTDTRFVGLLILLAVSFSGTTTGQSSQITTAGQPAQLDIRAAGDRTIRVTLKPLSFKNDFPATPAVVDRKYPAAALSLREIPKPVQKTVASLNVEVRPNPLTVSVKDARGQLVQELVFDADGRLFFKLDEHPVLGMGEGGPRMSGGTNWRTAPVEFDRRGRMHEMIPQWQRGAYGSRNPVALLAGTRGWGLFFATPWGQFDLRQQHSGRFIPIEAKDPAAMRQNTANQGKQLGKGLPPMEKFVPGLLDVFIFDARQPEVFMKDLSSISGAAVMPPRWSLGYMQSHRTLEDDAQMIGIVASLFTAVFFTRLIFDLVYKGRRRLQTLSI